MAKVSFFGSFHKEANKKKATVTVEQKFSFYEDKSSQICEAQNEKQLTMARKLTWR